ncbi:ethanolaminephosphotransferase 1 [Cricetulus griseus]|nr:ethanolaminephosphotransferase 1 [Cricetulus griseus]
MRSTLPLERGFHCGFWRWRWRWRCCLRYCALEGTVWCKERAGFRVHRNPMPKSSFCLASGESLEPHSASFRLLAQVRVSVMLSRLKMVEKSLTNLVSKSYVTEDALEHLVFLSVPPKCCDDRPYDFMYSALDTNPLSLYIMHPFWNTIVKVFPTWLAPNLITFSGFLLVVFNFLLLTYFDPDFYASAPGHKHVPDWVWIVVGILNFVAYTLDGVDGKQARRTNSSTPLGELFDHGLDSWSCVYFVVTVYSIFGRGPTGVSVFVLYLLLWVVLFSFILSHWEKYNTGILFLPWGYDISQVTISFVYIVTALVGVEAWYEPFLFNFLYRDLFTAMIIGCALCVTLPMSLLNFFRSYKSNTLKHNSIYEAMVPFFSPCLLFTLSTVWILRSPSDILEIHPRIFYFMVGTAFANITCQLIVCQMSSTRCPTLNWLLLPLFLVVAAVTIGAAASHLESLLLYALTAAFTLAHIHYGVQVVKQLSSHFQIYPFSLRKPNSD